MNVKSIRQQKLKEYLHSYKDCQQDIVSTASSGFLHGFDSGADFALAVLEKAEKLAEASQAVLDFHFKHQDHAGSRELRAALAEWKAFRGEK